MPSRSTYKRVMLGNGSDQGNNSFVQSYLNKITTAGYTPPTQSKINIYNAAFNSPEGIHVSSKTDLMGLLKTANVNLCKIPFIHSGGNLCTLENSPVFTADIGLKSNGSGWLDTHWIPASHGVNYIHGQNTIAAYTQSTTMTGGNNCMLGTYDVLNSSIQIIKGASAGSDVVVNGSYSARLCTGADNSTGSNVIGLYSLLSSGSLEANMKMFKNGSDITSGNLNGDLTEPISQSPFTICAVGGILFYPGDIAFYIVASKTIDQVKLNTFVNMLLL